MVRLKGCFIKWNKDFSKVVVNVAGPHSMKINKMAGVEDDMNIKTKALKVEVSHVSSPDKFNYESNAFVVSDSDIACYSDLKQVIIFL